MTGAQGTESVSAGNNTVMAHTLILSATTQLEVVDVDGLVGEEEDAQFPIPELPPVGGQASAIDLDSAPVIDEDPLGLASGKQG
jgi:hypothetical protein